MPVAQRDPLPFDVDAGGGGVQPQLHAGRFQVGVGAVGEVAPVGDLAGDVVRDAANAEVGVGVGDDDGDVAAGVEFARAQRGGDAGVAAADGDQVHQREASTVRRWALLCGMTTSSARWPISG
jgi:hypothetical protein